MNLTEDEARDREARMTPSSGLSAEKIAELKALAEKATHAERIPWRLSRTGKYVMDGHGSPWVAEVSGRPGWEGNAEYIVAACNAAPTLCDQITQLRSELEEAKGLLRALLEKPAAATRLAEVSDFLNRRAAT